MVDKIQQNYSAKSQQLRQLLSKKFKEMKAQLKVQEQICDAILKKNLQYVENELKNLKNIDYSKFNEAEKWLKKVKVKLDNFKANQNNPNYIAFDMLENAKQSNDEFNDVGDNLLDDPSQQNVDIIMQGENVINFLSQFKAINPNLLATQLNKLALVFDDKQLTALPKFAKCTTIEGVEVSQEELEAIQEAANAGLDVNDPIIDI